MTLFAGPIELADPLVKELLELIRAGLDDTADLRRFLDESGIARDDIDLGGSPATARKNTITALAKQGKLRLFVESMLLNPNFAAVSDQLRQLVAKADRASGTDPTLTPVQHIHVAMVGIRPFVNRVRLRENLEAMFVESGSRVMAVDGPRSSGRSYYP